MDSGDTPDLFNISSTTVATMSSGRTSDSAPLWALWNGVLTWSMMNASMELRWHGGVKCLGHLPYRRHQIEGSGGRLRFTCYANARDTDSSRGRTARYATRKANSS